MSWAAIAVGAISAGTGAYRYFHAKKKAKENIRPEYQLDPQYQQNIDILTNTMGLPQSALELYYQNIGQNTNQGINAILGAGGNGNQIASLVGNRNQNYQQIALMDALQKKQDIGGLLTARQWLADQRDKSFSLNLLNPFKDKAQGLAAEEAAGYSQIGGGLNSISAGIANHQTLKLAESLGDSGTGTTTPNSGVNTNLISQQLFQQFRQQQPQLNFGQPNNQFNFQQPQPLPFTPQQPQFQQQWTPQSLQAPPIPYANYQNSSPYGNTGLDYQAWFNYMNNNRY